MQQTTEKPKTLGQLFPEIKEHLEQAKLIISEATGINFEYIGITQKRGGWSSISIHASKPLNAYIGQLERFIKRDSLSVELSSREPQVKDGKTVMGFYGVLGYELTDMGSNGFQIPWITYTEGKGFEIV